MTPDEKRKTLETLLSFDTLQKLVGKALTKDEFLSLFREVLVHVKRLEADIIKLIGTRLEQADTEVSKIESKIDAKLSSADIEIARAKETARQAIHDLRDIVQETRDANATTLSSLKRRSVEAIDALFLKMRLNDRFDALIGQYADKIDAMNDKISDIPSKEEFIALIPEYIEETPEQTRDKLESIQDEEEKLAISAIAHLEEKLKDLEKRMLMRAGTIGGGFNYSAMDLHIIDDETPTGDIDGVNTIFTINNTPSPASSLKVFRGGARQRITEDYTFSGRTITFIIPPQVGEILLADYRV